LRCNKIFSLRFRRPLGLPKRWKMNADSPFFLAPDAAIWFFGLFGDVRNIRTPGLEQSKQPKHRRPAGILVLTGILTGLAFVAVAYPADAAFRRHKTPPAAGIIPMPSGATDPDKDAALI